MNKEGSETTLRRFFEISIDMLCVADTNGFFKLINPAFDRLGYSREELLAKPFVEFVHPDDRLATLEEIAQLANGIPTVHFENRYRRKDGNYVWLSWTAMPDESGLIYAVARDIGDRKRAQTALSQAQEKTASAVHEFEALTDSISHDLRAPLRAIDGFSRALAEDHANSLDDEGKRYLDRLRRNVQIMGRLLDDLIALARAGGGEITWSRVDLTDLARSLALQNQKNEPDRRVEIAVEEGLSVWADRRLVTLVMENLFQNAWKFTRKRADSRIEIGKSKEPGGTPYFFVKDNGVGFEMSNAKKLFVTFQKLHSQEEFEGSGIGLAITKRVINRLGGRIWAEGKPDEGAVIKFCLPDEAPQSAV